MQLVPIVCSKCGGTIQAPAGEKSCFCTFCGTQLLIDDGSKTVTYRTVDEARIREAEIAQALELKKLEIEETRRTFRLKLALVVAAIGVLMLVGGNFLGHASGDSNSPWYMVAMVGFFPLMGGGGLLISGMSSKE